MADYFWNMLDTRILVERCAELVRQQWGQEGRGEDDVGLSLSTASYISLLLTLPSELISCHYESYLNADLMLQLLL